MTKNKPIVVSRIHGPCQHSIFSGKDDIRPPGFAQPKKTTKRRGIRYKQTHGQSSLTLCLVAPMPERKMICPAPREATRLIRICVNGAFMSLTEEQKKTKKKNKSNKIKQLEINKQII